MATKTAWWIALPSPGRRVSAETRRAIAARRQKVADQLEKMEADTADRIELLTLARDLNERVAEAETDYRRESARVVDIARFALPLLVSTGAMGGARTVALVADHPRPLTFPIRHAFSFQEAVKGPRYFP
uniref:Uncharacterized protein n=1 Tax=Streptomyces sp. NBC_00180 TaxID=2903632 RepID=A0AAU1HQG1_9ACTN